MAQHHTPQLALILSRVERRLARNHPLGTLRPVPESVKELGRGRGWG